MARRGRRARRPRQRGARVVPHVQDSRGQGRERVRTRRPRSTLKVPPPGSALAPLGSALSWTLRLPGRRQAAHGGLALSGGLHTHWGAQPLPRVLELAAAAFADPAGFDHPGRAVDAAHALQVAQHTHTFWAQMMGKAAKGTPGGGAARDSEAPCSACPSLASPSIASIAWAAPRTHAAATCRLGSPARLLGAVPSGPERRALAARRPRRPRRGGRRGRGGTAAALW